ncbi:MAG TPA: tripartite tricarboxylate transporter substrate binding protein [Burkholderiaceae bacterium]|nr:tripartite tricarboxylate transporter substrate binding protein [Burkholderiaceae bacterium]
MNRRRLVFVPMLMLAGPSSTVLAQGWPARPVHVVIPIAAGSVSDLVPRLVMEQVAQQTGQSVVFENRPGAGMTLGTGAVAKAAPDGYTVLVTSSAHTIAPALYPNLNYQPTRDFVAVTPMGVSPFVLVVSPSKGYADAKALVAAAKDRPGTFNFSSPGMGTASHLSAERFRLSTGVQAVHVPFKGGVEAMSEVMAGRVDFFFMALGAALPHIRSGRLQALAVNSARRSAALPEVPTLRESGIADADYPTWFGQFLPAGTPQAVVEKLHEQTQRALQEPRIRDRLQAMGVEPMPMTQAEFEDFVRRQVAADAALVSAIGLKLEQ